MTALAEIQAADIMAVVSSGIEEKAYRGSGFITPFKNQQGGRCLTGRKS